MSIDVVSSPKGRCIAPRGASPLGAMPAHVYGAAPRCAAHCAMSTPMSAPMSTHVVPCRPMSTHVDRCRSMSIDVGPCRSMSSRLQMSVGRVVGPYGPHGPRLSPHVGQCWSGYVGPCRYKSMSSTTSSPPKTMSWTTCKGSVNIDDDIDNDIRRHR